MINSYFELVNANDDGFEDYLARINLLRIFESIFQEYEDRGLCKKMVLYVAYTHTIESDKISVGGDRRKECHQIFKDLKIPDEHYDDVVLLKGDAVLKSVQLWMRNQDSRQIEYLFTLQNAYVQQQAAALKDIRKSTSEIDFDQKQRCIEHMTELKKMIKDAESELQQNHEKLKEAYQDIKKATKVKNTIGPESFAV